MSKPKILCIDLDDTLALTANTILEYAIHFDKTILNRSGILKKLTLVEIIIILQECWDGIENN